MSGQNRVSGGQAALLLLLSRLFGLLTYTADTDLPPLMGLIAIILSGALQLGMLQVGIKLCSGPGARMLHSRWVNAAYAVFCFAAAVDTISVFTRFVAAGFYDWKSWWMITLLFAAAAVLAAVHGIEAVCRAALPLGAALALMLLLIAAGLWREYDVLNYSFAPAGAAGVARTALFGAAMNIELPAAILLGKSCDKLKSFTRSKWVIWSTASAAAVQTALALSLGIYAKGISFPVFAAASCAGFSVFRRLDALFMGIWVISGFLRLSLFLMLCGECWCGARLKPVSKMSIALLGLAAAVVSLANVACGTPFSLADALWPALALTAAGTLLLPLLCRAAAPGTGGNDV